MITPWNRELDTPFPDTPIGLKLKCDLFALSLHAWRTNMAKFDQRGTNKVGTGHYVTMENCPGCPSRFSKSLLGSEGDDRQTERTFQFHQKTQFIWSVYCNHSIWRDRWFLLEILNLVMYGIHCCPLSKDVFPEAWVLTDPNIWVCPLTLPKIEGLVPHVQRPKYQRSINIHKYP